MQGLGARVNIIIGEADLRAYPTSGTSFAITRDARPSKIAVGTEISNQLQESTSMLPVFPTPGGPRSYRRNETHVLIT